LKKKDPFLYQQIFPKYDLIGNLEYTSVDYFFKETELIFGPPAKKLIIGSDIKKTERRLLDLKSITIFKIF
jgi:hypothetical protein